MICHTLSENKKTGAGREFIFFDTETEAEKLDDAGEERHNLILGWAIYDRVRENGVTRDECYFEDQKDFWDFVENKARDKQILRMFAHNTGFDFRVLQGFRKLRKRGWELQKSISIDKPFWLTYKKNKKTIIILDTFNFFNMSLSSIGQKIGLEKKGEKGRGYEGISLKEYCKRDVEIIENLVLGLRQFIIDNDLGNMGITAGQQAFNCFRHKFKNDAVKINIHNNKNAIELERASYRGGRTECFYVGKVEDTLYKLDVNSMYPSVMFYHKYPSKLIKYQGSPSIRGLFDAMTKYLVIADVDFYIDDNAIGLIHKFKDGFRLVFGTGKQRGVLTSPELKYIQDHGQILKVYSYAIYGSEYLFKDYVNYFYNLRQEYKEAGNKVYSELIKLFLNSLYGKFGQRKIDMKCIGDTEEDDGVEKTYDVDTGEISYIYHIAGKKFEKKKTNDPSFNSFIAISSFVTSYARMYLWRLIKQAGSGNVYYCDTDSLIVNEEGLNNLQDKIDDKRLGYLKIEDVSDNAVFRNAKDYTFSGVKKTKGLRSDAIEIGENTYQQIQFEGMKGALRNGHLNEVRTTMIEKRFNQEYKKGIVQNGWVKPYVFK